MLQFTFIILALLLACCNTFDLNEWLKHMKDKNFHCKKIGEENLLENEDIFTFLSCDQPEARWNYKYKVKSLSKGDLG